MNDDAHDEVGQTVIQRLRAAGIRATVPRISVLQILEASETQWLDVDEVFRTLFARGLSVGQGTVYRTLKDLSGHGLALQGWRNGLNGSKAVYSAMQAGPAAPAHDARIVCSECGRTTQIDDPALREQLRQLALRQGLDLTAQSMVVLAACASCSRHGGMAAATTTAPRKPSAGMARGAGPTMAFAHTG